MVSPKEMTQKREVGSAGEAKAAILNGAVGGEGSVKASLGEDPGAEP